MKLRRLSSPVRRVVPFVAVLAVSGVSSVAYAQPVNEARVAFQEGVRQYAEHHYAEALESFRRAYRIRPHPSVLVNIANCHVALNQPQQAVSLFERYLNDPTNTLSPEQRAEIQHGLDEAQRQLATVTLHVVPTGAEVFLDGDLVGAAPLRRSIQTGPGPHVFEARMSGSPSQQYQARLAPGGQLTITLDLSAGRSYIGSVATPPAPVVTPVPVVPPPPTPVVTPVPVVAPVPVPNPNPTPSVVVVEQPLPPPPPPTTPRRGVPAAFWVGLTLTLAAGATSAGFIIYAETLAQDYNDLVRQRDATTDANQRAYLRDSALAYADAVDSNRQFGLIMGGVAGAALLFTVIAPVAFGRSTPARAQPVQALRVSPSFGAGQGFVLSGAF